MKAYASNTLPGSTVNTIKTWMFANSIWNPFNIQSSDPIRSPMWPTWNALYKYYRVQAVKIFVRIHNIRTQKYEVYVVPHLATTVVNYPQLTSGVTRKILFPGGSAASIYSTVYVKKYFRIKSVLQDHYDPGTTRTLFGEDPPASQSVLIATQLNDIVSGSDILEKSVNIDMWITQYTKMWGRTNFGGPSGDPELVDEDVAWTEKTVPYALVPPADI